MSSKLPAISGKKLIRLLEMDGWSEARRANHGVALAKPFGDRTRVTIVPDSRATLPIGTLMAILGPKQTDIGRGGFLKLINTYGL